MDNTKKDRTTLKGYFKNNAVPTEDNFKDLIDAGLNQKEDGIAKVNGGPIAIQSAGATEDLIHFYKNFADAAPTWRISQKQGNQSGFGISDANSTNRVFIDAASGNIGLGITTPVAKLDLNALDPNGLLIRGGNLNTSSVNSQLTFGFNGTTQYRHAIKTRHNSGAPAGNAIDFYVWKQGTDADTTVGSKQVITLDGNGNVGVGMVDPQARLDVSVQDSNGVLIRGGNNADQFGNSQLTLGFNGTTQYRHAIKTRHSNGAANANAIDFYLWKQGTDNVAVTGTQHAMTLDGSGNVGIGTTGPAAKLDVNAADANGLLIRSGNAGAGTANSQLTLGSNGTAQYRHAIKTRHNTGGVVGNAIDFYLWKQGTDNPAAAGTQHAMTLDGNGNVGIGVTAPVAKLDVNVLDANGLLIRSGNSSAATAFNQLTLGFNGSAQYRHAIKTRHNSGGLAGNAIDFYLWKQGVDGADAAGTQHGMTLDGNGNVGLGITTPTAKLHVIANGNANPDTNGLYVYNPTSTAGQDAIVAARVNNATGGNPFLSLDVAGITGWSIGIDNQQDQALKFSNQWNSITGATKMTLLKNGNLGIGTPTPGTRLEVVGQVKIVDGTQAAGRVLTSDANGAASWMAVRRDFRPYGAATYLWDGTARTAINGSDPQSMLSVRGGAGLGKYDNFNPWGRKSMFGIGSLSQEAQGTTTAPGNGIYLTLPVTQGVHNSLLLSTIDHDRWSIWVVWLCDINGNPVTKIMRSSNNANVGVGAMASSYPVGPRNTPKETGEHAWLTFPVTAQQVAAYSVGGNMRFLLTSGPQNGEGGGLYLSGFAMVPNPYGYVQHPGLSLHWGVNGNATNEITWGGNFNNEAYIFVPVLGTSAIYVKVVDPERDLLVTFHEHNSEWYGGTIQVKVGGDPTIYGPSSGGFVGIASSLYTGKRNMRQECILIPSAVVKAQLVTSPSAVPSMLRLQLYNPGSQNYNLRGVDTEIF